MTSITIRPASVASILASVAAATVVSSADASVVLSNLPGSGSSGLNMGGRAMLFTTGSGSWNLQSATVFGLHCQAATFAIWTDSAGSLGSLFATGSYAGTALGSGNLTATFTGTTLAGNTNYWFVFTSGFAVTYDTSTVASAQNSSGWVGYGNSLEQNLGSSTWLASATTTYFEVAATVAGGGGGGVPLPGAAGLAACGLAGLSRRKRR